MSSHIQNLVQNVLGDGARSSKYDVMLQFTNPDLFPDQRNVAVLIKNSNFPSKSHQTIDLKYKGRSIPVRGQVKYTHTWECTFYLNENHSIKNAFEAWIEALDEKVNYPPADSNLVASTKKKHSSLEDYTKDICIYQQHFEDTSQTARCLIHNVFPIEVSAVQVSAEGPGQLLEFTVTFSFSYFDLDVVKGSAGNFIDGVFNRLQSAIQSGAGTILDALNSRLNTEINNFMSASGLSNLQSTIDEALNGRFIEQSASEIADLIKGTNSSYSPGAWLGAGLSGVSSVIKSSLSELHLS